MSKKTTKTTGRRVFLTCLVVILSLAAIFLALIAFMLDRAKAKDPDDQNFATGMFTTGAVVVEGTAPAATIEVLEDFQSQENKGLRVTKIGSYTGIYVEDGSDEVISRVLMIMVENTGSEAVQYAEIELTDGSATAYFTLTTLPPGEKIVLLEKNRMSYADGKGLTKTTFKNVAVFQYELELYADQLEVQPLDGFLNITNISEQDITGNVVIYYKNASKDVLYGGITYRVTVEGGIKAGEVKQLAASHFFAKGSRVMFITVS